MNNNPVECQTIDFGVFASQIALRLINNPYTWDRYDIDAANDLIKISNIMYNNTTIIVLPLDDGVYDQLLVLLKHYKPDYSVGAIPTIIQEQAENFIDEDKIMYVGLSEKQENSKLYIHDIWDQHTNILSPDRPKMLLHPIDELITKRFIDTQHKYPELVGTLDKCKFVLTEDARAANVLDQPSVSVFERDYIHMCLDRGVITPIEKFEMVAELKYDGVSVEAEVCGDRVITALSRGDTGENVATDLTPIFKNYVFYNAKNVPKETFGIKFEAVITRRNLDLLSQARGVRYKNARNAIIGILGASDGPNYIDYITLIPISTSLGMDRIAELNFLNHYYNTGEYNRFCILRGNYQEILFQVKQFTDSAEIMRTILPYLIDGVVISFTDKQKIAALGRENSVNKYQMAIKFNPKTARSIFLGYTYTMGKSGNVIPMVHFKPVEFIGTIHTKQTVHSYQRFKELSLRKGNEIEIQYVNEVLTYVSKPNTELNRNIDNAQPPEEFIKVCPYCGTELVVSDSGKVVMCPNINCHERKIMRMVDMIRILGFKDFSEESVRALDLTEFSRLATMYSYNELEPILGPVTADKFRLYQHDLISNPIEDYKIMAALSFDNLGSETWKKILSVYTIRDLISFIPEELHESLTSINGIGGATCDSILNGFAAYANDINFILANMKVIDSKGYASKPKVALTGTRDPVLIDIIKSQGYDCDESYNVTKDVAILITTDKNSTTSKMAKAQKYGISIMTPAEFMEAHNIKVGTF